MMRVPIGVVVLAVVVLGIEPMCNVSLPGDVMCGEYCTGRCGMYNASAGDTGQPTNITLYRLTPRSVTDLCNKNTGDAPGDVGFILNNREIARMCALNQTQKGCFLSNTTNNVYARFEVEIDGQFGPYYQCNPLYQNISNPFVCDEMCDTPPDCNSSHSYYPRENGTFSWQGSTCFCPHCPRCTKSVGRSHNPYTWRVDPPEGWPNQCAHMDKSPQCVTGEVQATVVNTVRPGDLQATIELACTNCSRSCAGWAVTDVNTAVIFSTVHNDSNASSCLTSGVYDRHKWTTSANIGGYWFSTPKDGQCPPGAPLGTNGCTWREVAPRTFIDAQCADSRVDDAVELHGKACFDLCQHPLNKTSICYLNCYESVLLGDPIYNISRMEKEALVAPWLSAFDIKGGCPRLNITSPP